MRLFSHPMNQNFNSFGFDHIQLPQQFDNHQHQEIPEVTPFVESKEWIETNNELYTIMEDFMKRMNQQREQEALLVAQHEQELREQEQATQEKDELSPNFVFHHKVKVIRCDNGTEFKNREMDQFCEMKGILRQFSVARTPQQNRVTKRRNMTLIEPAMTMIADSKLPTTFWAQAVNTACYVQNRVLVVKPHNKTPYELFHGRTPTLSFMRPFGCPITILNTIDHLAKFDGKANEGSGPYWQFDIDALTRTMNYEPIVA
ncbi:ribonuclease H-like domain-containing protein, partial [Tanacetum coccineum]